MTPHEDLLLHKNTKQFIVKCLSRWKGLSFVPLILCPIEICPKGSPLIREFWSTWNMFKNLLHPSGSLSLTTPWFHLDSIWFNFFKKDCIAPHQYGLAKVLVKKGLRA